MYNLMAETACLLAAFVLLSKSREWWAHPFILFLTATVVVETIGYALHLLEGNADNRWMYNIYLLFEMGFYFYVLARWCRRLFPALPVLVPGFVLFLTLYVIESVRSGWAEYSVYANLAGSVIIIITSCFFYYSLMKQEEPVEIERYPVFWMITGLFVFYLGSIGCTVFARQLTFLYQSKGLPLRYIIMIVLNFILYACWIYAFICTSRPKISPLPSSPSR